MLSYSLGETSPANNILLYCGYLMHFEKHLQGTQEQSSKEVNRCLHISRECHSCNGRYQAESSKQEFVLC